MPKKTKKSYIIVDKERNFCHGAFEHTEEGLSKAQKYLEQIERNQKKAFKIIEK